MLTVFYILVVLLCLQGIVSLLDGIRYLAFVRRALDKPPENFAPRASVLIPCKGMDVELKDNLRALFRQDYPEYEIIFVVASEDDAALPVIRQLINEQPTAFGVGDKDATVTEKGWTTNFQSAVTTRQARVLIAGKDVRRSEKVNNLLRAVDEVSGDSEVLVFVDSDARVRRDWLRSLVAPLKDKTIGATTGFRWYLPETGGIFSAMLSAWNGSVATTLGDHGNNFAWGGSTAILKKTFASADVRRAWAGAVSDDYALTRAVKNHGLRIAFVPRCMTVTREDATLASLLEFTTRQVIITRVYNARLWWMGIISQVLFTVVFFGGLLFSTVKLIAGKPSVLALVLLATVYLLGSAKGVLRLLAARRMLPGERRAVTRLWWAYGLLWVGVSVLYLFNFLKSAMTRRIHWRGVTYELRSPSVTVIPAGIPAALPE